jgi:sarcosine oxidase subunit alpha
MRIDGEPNRPSCMVPVTPGLRCERQGVTDAEVDVLRAADWFFPSGMDHHHLMTGTRIGNELFVKLVRHLGAAGELPDRAPSETPRASARHIDACVVGAGPAGLTAAATIARAAPGVRVVLYDEQRQAGGSLTAEPDGAARARELVAGAIGAGVEIVTGATALAVYREPGDGDPASAGAGVLAVRTPEGFQRVAARAFVYATGGYDQNLAFAGNDRPGFISARACGRLAFHFGVVPAAHVTLLEEGTALPYAERLLAGLAELGIATARLPVSEASGLRLGKNAAAVVATPAPAFELPRQHGARVTFAPARGGFPVVVDDDGATATLGVFAAGDVTGYMGPERAAAEGARVGRAVARRLSD